MAHWVNKAGLSPVQGNDAAAIHLVLGTRKLIFELARREFWHISQATVS